MHDAMNTTQAPDRAPAPPQPEPARGPRLPDYAPAGSDPGTPREGHPVAVPGRGTPGQPGQGNPGNPAHQPR